MNKFTLVNLLLILLLANGHAVSAPASGVAATVNGEEIPESRLQKSIDNYVKIQGGDMSAINDAERLKSIRNELLDVLISQELLWQAARKENIIVDDKVLDGAFAEYEERFKDASTFEDTLKEGGFNKTTFRQTLKQKLSAKLWVQKFVLPDVTVNKDEIHEFYLQSKDQLAGPREVRARHILIKVKPSASEEEKNSAKAILNELKKQLEDGADFAELAKQKSQGPSASRGGDLGYFGSGKMVKPFETAAFNLKKGEVSDIVETRFGFHIIKSVDIKTGAPYQESEVADEIETLLRQQKAKIAVDEAISKLRQQASIEKKAL